MSIKNLITQSYKKAKNTAWDSVVYVNHGKKYISVKIDEPHLTEDEMVKFKALLTIDETYGHRVLRVINTWSNGYFGKSEKVLVRLTKSPK